MYPLDEQIARVVFERLEITQGASSVVRKSRKLADWTPEDNQIVLVKVGPARFPGIDCQGNPPAYGWTVTLNIYCHKLQSEFDDTPTEELMAELVSNAMLAITTDSNWGTMDGNAIDSNFGNMSFPGVDGFDCVMVPLTVLFRVNEFDMYTPR